MASYSPRRPEPVLGVGIRSSVYRAGWLREWLREMTMEWLSRVTPNSGADDGRDEETPDSDATRPTGG